MDFGRVIYMNNGLNRVRRVAISANTSWYIYNFRKNTVKRLVAEGYSVTIIAPEDSYTKLLEDIGCEFFPLYLDQGGMNPFKEMRTLFSLLNCFFNCRYDILLNFTPKNNIYGTLLSFFFDTKVINNIAGLGSIFVERGFKRWLVKTLYKVSQKFAHTIYFQNGEDLSLFMDERIINSQMRVLKIPGSGVDLERFTVKTAQEDGVVKFLLVARMLREKGIYHYVDAARKLKNKYGTKVEFRLLGFLDVNNPGAVKKSEMELWESEGVIRYLGVTDSVELEIENADCVVLPSYYREGVPRSLLEAAAMGKPLVTTNNVGCKETVDDGINGFLCEPKSTEALVIALEKIIKMDSSQRIEMGRKGREKVESQFSEEYIINSYIESVELSLR